jgi:hypothetical protein
MHKKEKTKESNLINTEYQQTTKKNKRGMKNAQTSQKN